ncbi:hypothetical protein FA13DRAFT_1723595 [Coprinellus micaceus]|uniref:Pentacotripeptide-repeat region of PRORP domain-containing protein n=1 Tax=Coprinellus micaceus TaxID=71717 RepID=A0A4Y7TZ19_COPMI|nr:hypothetical protein FA13DRAFT_1723595 [Coprinellus micaceus]
MEYALDEMLARQYPQHALDVCAAWLGSRTLEEPSEVSQEHRFAFLEGLLRSIVIHWTQTFDVVPDKWIAQLEELLAVKGSPLTDPLYDGQRRVLNAHILALKGDIGQADTLLRKETSWSSSQQRIDTINAVIVSLCRTRPPQEVLKYLEDGVDNLPPPRLSSYRGGPAMKALSNLFHDGSFDSLIPERTPSFHPAVFLVKRILLGRRDVSEPVPQRWVKEVIKAVMLKPGEVNEKEIRGTYVDGAYPSPGIYDVMPPLDVQGQVLRAETLEELLALYEGSDAFWYSAKLFLASLTGDVGVAKDCFNHFARMAVPGSSQVNSLLNAYANAGDIRGLTKTFDRLFPSSPGVPGVGKLRPAFYALARSPVPQHEAMECWREKLRQTKVAPGASIYTLLAKYYAKHGDGSAIQLLFQEIQENGIRVNRLFYRVAMNFFAKRGEVETLQSLSDHAKLNGITLDARPDVSLDPVDVARTEPPSEITLQYDALRGRLRWLKATGRQPHHHFYCKLAKAARDAGDMEAAEKLYLEMVDRDAEDPGFLNSPHIFTILISGHVRHGNIQKALSIYKEMTDRGITGATPERVIRTLRVGMAKLPEVEATRLEQVLNTIVADAFPGDSAKLGLGMDIGPRHRSSSP